MTGVVSDVFVIRHGERLDHSEPNWLSSSGHSRSDDPPLNAKGLTQISELSARFERQVRFTAGASPEYDIATPIRHIFSSPYVRCVATASAVSQAVGGPRVQIENGICEVIFRSPPQYLSAPELHYEFQQVDTDWPSLVTPRSRERGDWPCANRSGDVALRIVNRIDEESTCLPSDGTDAEAQPTDAHEGEGIAVVFVGHGSSCAGIVHRLTNNQGTLPYQGICCVTHLKRRSNAGSCIGDPVFDIVVFNDSSHLSDQSDLRAW